MSDAQELDRAAWRDCMIRMQTRLDGAEGANVMALADFSLAALRRAARDNLHLAEALGTGPETDQAIAWYGLEPFLTAVRTALAVRGPDPADRAEAEAAEAYRTRGVLYRIRVAVKGMPDTLLRRSTLAEDRLKVRAFVARELDADTRLVWALFTLQTLRDAAEAGETPRQFIARLDAEIPDYRMSLDEPDFAELLADLAALPERVTPVPRRLNRRRRTR